jgi:hypothetical protein
MRAGPAPEIAGVDGLGGAANFSYVRYSCVVADQWRRSILVLPSVSEKVCVGNPALVLDTGDPSDQLKSNSRFYDGRAPILDVNGVMVEEYPYGVKGAPLGAPQRSVAGSVCMDGDSCWDDESIRGLVPGGHHFVVMPDTGTPCSERMNELALIDADAGTYYAKLFARNPDLFFCTSEKSYNGDFCTWYTRVSGFIENEATSPVAGADFAITATNPQLLEACSQFGAFGEGGGGYVCGVRHSALGATVNAVALDGAIGFLTPRRYDFINPSPAAFPLDAASRGFVIADSGSIPVDPDPVDPDPVDPDPVDPDPVDPGLQQCNVTVSGTRNHQNATVSYNIDGQGWTGCVSSGTNQAPTYQCYRAGAAPGNVIQVRSVRTPGNHPVLGDEFTVSCTSENVTVTIDF